MDLLPALMIYAALNTKSSPSRCSPFLADCGSTRFRPIRSASRILPLFAVGFPIYLRRDLILRELPFAQIVLGAVASAVVPALTVLFLLTGGKEPLLGWGSLWQWIVMTAGGALATPVIFALFDWCNHALGYQPRTETSFRPDREIRRGRK